MPLINRTLRRVVQQANDPADVVSQANKILAPSGASISPEVAAQLLKDNPDMTAQQLANVGGTRYWQNEIPSLRVLDAVNKGTAKVVRENAPSEEGSIDLHWIEDPETGKRLQVYPDTRNPNLYSFNVGNPTAGGRLSGVLMQDEGGKFVPITDASKQFSYTPGQPGGFMRNVASGIGDLVSDPGFALMLGPLGGIFPAAAPFIQAGGATLAASQGNIPGAILGGIGAASSYYGNQLSGLTDPSSAGAVSGTDLASDIAATGINPAVPLQNRLADLNLARTAVKGVNAAMEGDPLGVLKSAYSGYKQAGGTMPLVETVTSGITGANPEAANELSRLFATAKELADNPNIKLASAAVDVTKAFGSQDPNAIINSLGKLAQFTNTPNAPRAPTPTNPNIMFEPSDFAVAGDYSGAKQGGLMSEYGNTGLRAAAQHLAQHGRRGDTTLVHMTPSEVRKLQQLAQMRGKSLTVNPHTGLPEANILTDIFGDDLGEILGMVAPIALGAFLGPGAFGISGLGLGAGQAALATGLGTAALTGSLEKGLMAGLGAYGGAALGGATSAGVDAAKSAAISNAMDMAGGSADLLGATGSAASLAPAELSTGAAFKAALGPEGLGKMATGDLLKYGSMAAAPLIAAMSKNKMDGTEGSVYTPTAAVKPSYAYRDSQGNVQFVDLPGVKMEDWDITQSPSQYAHTQIAEPRYAADGGLMNSDDLVYQNSPVMYMADGGSTGPSLYSPYQAGLANPETIPRMHGETVEQAKARVQSWQDELDQRIKKRIEVSGRQVPDTINYIQTPTDRSPVSGDDPLWTKMFETLPRTGPSWGGGGDGGGSTTPTTPAPTPAAPAPSAPPGTGGGGTIVTNPDGSITTHPTIPGRPDDGFGGMSEVRKAYTQGGGSLGQVLTPRAEGYTNTGMSADAYKYLMGQGPSPTHTQAGPTISDTFSSWPPSDAEIKANKAKRYVWKGGKLVDNLWFGKDSASDTGASETSPLFGGSDSSGGAKEGGLLAAARGGHLGGSYNLGDYSDGGRLLRGPGDGVSDSIPATIGGKRPARLADGEFVVPARIVSEIGNGSTEAGARKLYAMMERVQQARKQTVGKGRSKVAKNTRADKYLPV